MTASSRQEKAASTKRASTRRSLLDSAATVFTDRDYSGVRVEHIANHAAKSTATYYTVFSGKSAWGTAVIEQRLNEALDRVPTVGAETPRTRLVRHLGLLAEVAASLPGITKALLDERAERKVSYSGLLPRYHGEVTQDLTDGQERQVFRRDMPPADLADFAIDGIALANAVHLDNPSAREVRTSLVLNGLRAR